MACEVPDEHQPLLRVLDQRVQQHADRRHRRRCRTVGSAVAASVRDRGRRLPASRRPATLAPSSERRVASASSVTSSRRVRPAAARPVPVSVMTTSSSRRGSRATASTCRTDGPGQRRVLHHRDLLGQLGEQPDGAAQHVVEVDGLGQEALDGPALAGGQRLDLRQPVDEQPVALVGRDPAGRGVRLGDVALVLQHGHVVADGRRRDPEVVPLDQRLRPDRLAGGDVVGDDRAQHLETPVVRRHDRRSTLRPRDACTGEAAAGMALSALPSVIVGARVRPAGGTAIRATGHRGRNGPGADRYPDPGRAEQPAASGHGRPRR